MPLTPAENFSMTMALKKCHGKGAADGVGGFLKRTAE